MAGTVVEEDVDERDPESRAHCVRSLGAVCHACFGEEEAGPAQGVAGNPAASAGSSSLVEQVGLGLGREGCQGCRGVRG